MPTVVETFAANPLLLLFAVAGIGFLLGRIEIAGVGLGVSAVLFVGLGAGSLDPALRLPDVILQFGLVTFVYVVGLSTAPGFFASMGRRGVQTALLGVGAVGLGAAMIAVGARMGLAGPTAAGLFTGALTNTPALAAVIDALAGTALAGDPGPALGYALAYPGGVLGVLTVIALAPKLLGFDPAHDPVTAADAPGVAGGKLELATVLIGDVPVMSSVLLRERLAPGVVFGRLRRGDRISVVTDDVVLLRGDVVNVIGESPAVEAAVAALGERSPLHLELDRAVVDFRRITVSNPRIAERPLGELGLDLRFGAQATRVRRGDVELVPTLTTHLELGDAVRVVAPREQMAAVSAYLGDSHRALAEIDVISFSLGIGLGLLLGLVPIPLPDGSSFTLGLAGGPLVVGLVLGRLGRSGPLVWTLPHAASLTLRQVGLVLFLAGVGTRSGWAFAQAVAGGGVAPIIALGAAVTVTVAMVTMVVGMRVLHLPGSVVMGVVAGIQTQPAALAFAIERTKNEVPSAGYAAVYPVATVAKIVIAQLLLRL